MKIEFKKPQKNRVLARFFFRLVVIGVILIPLISCRDANYEKMEGVWETKLSNGRLAVIIVEKEQFTILDTGTGIESALVNKKFKFILDSDKSPKQFEAPEFGSNKEGMHGIFEISGKQLKLSFAEKKQPRPASFTEKDTWIFENKGASENNAPTDSTYLNGVKTWNYWVDLNRVFQSNASLIPQLKENDSIDEGLKVISSTIDGLGKIRGLIGALPVAGVDSDLASYTARCNNSLGKLESLFGELKQATKDMKSFAARSTSDESLGERFVDWLTDNPDGEYSDLQREKKRIMDNILAIQKKLQAAETEFHNIESEQINLRSNLSKKYNREFPQI